MSEKQTKQEQKPDILKDFKLATQAVGYRDTSKRRKVYAYIEKSLKRDEQLKQVIHEILKEKVLNIDIIGLRKSGYLEGIEFTLKKLESLEKIE